MKKISLVGLHGAGKVALVDDEDHERVAAYRWHLSPGGYVLYSLNSREKIYLHVLILGAKEGAEVDHRSGNKLDCRKSNLRYATHRENMLNRKKAIGTSSQFKGVSWHKDRNKWTAHIKVWGKLRHLGSFGSETEAALAYDNAAMRNFGEYSRLNFPGGLEFSGKG